MNDKPEPDPAARVGTNQPTNDEKKKNKPEIPSGLAYVNTPGLLKRILEKAIEAPAPEKITQDYLANVWQFSGGSAMSVLPLLKKLDLLASDGTPTSYYKDFRTNSRRNSAIRHALRTGFPDIYRQTDYAENAKEEKIADIVLGLTGRTKTDQTVRAILGTFRTLVEFLNDEDEVEVAGTEDRKIETPQPPIPPDENSKPYGLSYQINIVLPESTDIEVFDAIFRKLKEHLL